MDKVSHAGQHIGGVHLPRFSNQQAQGSDRSVRSAGVHHLRESLPIRLPGHQIPGYHLSIPVTFSSKCEAVTKLDRPFGLSIMVCSEWQAQDAYIPMAIKDLLVLCCGQARYANLLSGGMLSVSQMVAGRGHPSPLCLFSVAPSISLSLRRYIT